MYVPDTCLLKYLSPRVVSKAKTKVRNAPKPSKNVENKPKRLKMIQHVKIARKRPKASDTAKTSKFCSSHSTRWLCRPPTAAAAAAPPPSRPWPWLWWRMRIREPAETGFWRRR